MTDRPKAALVFLITANSAANQSVFHVVFASIREVFDRPPPNGIHFYPGKGQDGEARTIHSHPWRQDITRYQQWFGVMTTEKAVELKDSLLSTGAATISEVPATFQFSYDAKLDTSWLESDVDRTNRSPKYSEAKISRYTYSQNSILDVLGFTVLRHDFPINLRSVENEQYPIDIFPYAYYSRDELVFLLKSKVCLVYERINCTGFFHGQRKKDAKIGEDSYGFTGFIQYSPIDREGLLVAFYPEGEQNQKPLATSDVNVLDGRWKIELSSPKNDGVIKVLRRDTLEVIAGEHFRLITNINFESHISSRTYKDPYGRSHFFGDKSNNKVKIVRRPDARMFFRESFHALSDMEYDQMICSHLSDLFVYCAPILFITDPYLLGEIVVDNGSVRLSRDQTAYVTAISLALIQTRFDAVYFLGMRNRVKKFWPNPAAMPTGYEVLVKELGKLQPATEWLFRSPSVAFHDRRVFALEEVGGNLVCRKGIILNTSANGIIRENEFTTSNPEDGELERVSSRMLTIWTEAENSEVPAP